MQCFPFIFTYKRSKSVVHHMYTVHGEWDGGPVNIGSQLDSISFNILVDCTHPNPIMLSSEQLKKKKTKKTMTRSRRRRRSVSGIYRRRLNCKIVPNVDREKIVQCVDREPK